ncbi:sensor histidine kinase [Nonomuraea pusilla]|uniref:histidine kinase n=1 Tax=Nonomuraea pusilla TaxID=46177 RepID=A0A1H7QY32_9ACTN|nr:histidine kinase [Nonomuraea pusilla]SEL52910.1 Histidine kinase-, DNA gyrase B-, and HSP90-like ATPase [Nonomuraea pusilla]
MRLARIFLTPVRFFRRPRVSDTTLVLVMVVFAGLGAAVMSAAGDVRGTLAAVELLVCAPLLLWRRSRPVVTAAAVSALDVAGFAGDLVQTSSVPTAVALYSLGRYAAGRTAAVTAGAAAVCYAVVMEVTEPGVAGWLVGALSPLVPAGIGQFVRIREELKERSKREAADSAVRAERRRIARELHDVVAHHISVINALVGGARATLPPGQDVTRDALESAEQTARQALSEMRQLLDVLRADDLRTGSSDGAGGAEAGPAGTRGGTGADAATGVGAERLPALVREARSAGLPTSLDVTGEPGPLPAAVDHAVYRIVQEALTNTRKHALGARASVRLAYEQGSVEVEVLDDGAVKHQLRHQGGQHGRQAVAPGFGLGGMAERVALCGGQLSTGPRPEGGFRVHARIPLERP